MTKTKRDQRPFDTVRLYLPGPILNTTPETVRVMDDPCQAKPGLGGMTAYPPKAMAVVCILMEAEMKTYRKMVGYLKMHPDVVRRIGLSGVPSKNTIWRAYGRIPGSYLREAHLRIVRDVTTGSPAGSSTICHPGNRFTGWFSIRHDRTETKRGWIKLHSIIDVSARAIPDCHVADGYAADITGMWPVMDRLAPPARAATSSARTRPTRAGTRQAAVRGDSQPGPDAQDPAQTQRHLQERRQPGPGGHDPDARGRPRAVHVRVITSAASSRPSLGQSRRCTATTSGAGSSSGRAGRRPSGQSAATSGWSRGFT